MAEPFALTTAKTGIVLASRVRAQTTEPAVAVRSIARALLAARS
ncbi:hypothetical protein [Solihabitans fulvus]|nr:hypothetical protein [Solihabitans fulvus]